MNSIKKTIIQKKIIDLKVLVIVLIKIYIIQKKQIRFFLNIKKEMNQLIQIENINII